VTALCNQPEAFASDLGDQQSRYLWWQRWRLFINSCQMQLLYI